jgi:hypothetical protein
MIKLRALGGTIIELSKKQPLFVRRLSIFFVFQEPQKFMHPARKKNFWWELITGPPTNGGVGGLAHTFSEASVKWFTCN